MNCKKNLKLVIAVKKYLDKQIPLSFQIGEKSIHNQTISLSKNRKKNIFKINN